MDRPDCFKCLYFAITYQKDRPYACMGMGFSSRQLPCREVLEASGEECRLFRPKPEKDRPA